MENSKALEGVLTEEAKDEGIDPFHPLYNPLIVKNVVRFLDVDTLKDVRTLSSLWNHFAVQELKEEAWITLTHDEAFCYGIQRFFSHMEAVYPDPADVLYQNYRLKFLNLTQKNYETTRIKDFWTTYGPFVKVLHLKRCYLEKPMLGKILSPEWTPKLESLILEDCSYAEAGPALTSSTNRVRRLRVQINNKGQFASPFDLKCLWDMFPELKDLTLTDLTEDQTCSILEAAAVHRKESRKPFDLMRLNIFGEEKYSIRKIPRHNFEFLCASAFPLRRLELDIGEDIEASEFSSLLKSFSRTLEILVIWRGLLANKIRGFPYSTRLHRLRHLRIPDSCIEDFGFLGFTPDLRALTVLQCDLEPMAFETDVLVEKVSLREGGDRELEPLHGLTQLRIEFKVREGDIEFLREVFPKLIRLSAFLGDSVEIEHSYF